MMTKLIFEKSVKGTEGITLTDENIDFSFINSKFLNEATSSILPEISELEVMRHYKELSDKNFCIEKGFYPLGSCTMKYNPKVNELLASLDDFAQLHPLQDDEDAQGSLKLMYNLQEALKEITGMDAITLQPAAGAHGELTGMMIVQKYFETIGQDRKNVIIPDSAHGTNPASAAVCGLEIVEVKSTPKGTVDVEDLKPLLDDTIAGIMMTNPNTLGIFETEIPEIARLVHDCGGLLYYDGANLNAVLGKCRPGDMGFDIMHINLHKTFSTPHGGGGPGDGPVGVRAGLEALLPNPQVKKDSNGKFYIDTDEKSAGYVSNFLGNFGVLLRAYTYILTLGRENVKMVGPLAVLNANYVKESLKNEYYLPIEGICKHEFVFDGLADKSTGVTTLDIAKRLLDYGYHAPTIYFPLLFHQSIMIEPTETESKETLDEFIAVMKKVAEEAVSNPDIVKSAPHSTPVRRLDETTAARFPKTTYRQLKGE